MSAKLLNEDRLTIAEAAAKFGTAELTIRRWYQKGLLDIKLETVRIGGRVYTTQQALVRFVEKCNK